MERYTRKERIKMDGLQLKQRLSDEEAVENWDDDLDFQGFDDLQFRSVSTTTLGSSHRRDSTSSRMSTRSDRDSVGATDEDWQVLLPEDDEKSTADAISSAKSAGIPIPQNVPASALLGGTIKRLGGRRLKKVLADDWSEDIDVPKFNEGGLKLTKKEAGYFPDSLKDLTSELPSSPTFSHQPHKLSLKSGFISGGTIKAGGKPLENFKDDDNDDFFGDVPTIKVAKNRPPQKLTNILPFKMTPKKDAEDMEADFELPADDQPLKLSARKDEPHTPASNMNDDFDLDWAEGSLGTRFGGTRRDVRSNHSSSMSAFSPSASSCLTAESEDDGLEGLIMPDSNFKFEDALKKRVETTSQIQEEKTDLDQPEKPAQSAQERDADKPQDDFLAGLDIGDGEVFDSRKLTLNRNIKHKEAKQVSPNRRPATTLTFTNKGEPGASKIPRYQFHERQRSILESVSESGPVPSYRRSASRLAGHSPQSSSTVSTPPTPSSHNLQPSTPSRRGLNNKASQDMLRSPNTTNPSQYLKAKRSMPAIPRNVAPPPRPPPYQRPPSRSQGAASRPKTPIDRSGAESSMSNARKTPAPFLSGGTSHSQSHHISVKTSRTYNRPTSSDSNDGMSKRPLSRLSHTQRAGSPTKGRYANEALMREANAKRPVTKPAKGRRFGDGNELEIFDDLPTSASVESKFLKQPIARGAPKSIQNRNRLGLHSNSSTTSLSSQPASQPQATPLSPIKNESVPRFARDTNASRLAREHRIGSVSAALHGSPALPTVRETSTLSSLGINRQPQHQTSQRHLSSQPHHSKRRPKAPPQKPRLIKPMGEVHSHPKEEKGMSWNPVHFRWEGNENALAPFDVPTSSPSSGPKSPGGSISKAAPALIANVGMSKGVQMSGGMVFDPQRMCWLKAAPSARDTRVDSNPFSPDTTHDDDDDPFAGIDDLDDKPKSSGETRSLQPPSHLPKPLGSPLAIKSRSPSGENPKEELEPLVVGEEFDVGPEFIKRLRVEEERWRMKLSSWVGEGVVRDDDDGQEWKWAIRAKARSGRQEA